MTDIDAELTEIARRHLFLDTLEEQGWGRLDCQEHSVNGIRKALQAAYAAGRAAAQFEAEDAPAAA